MHSNALANHMTHHVKVGTPGHCGNRKWKDDRKEPSCMDSSGGSGEVATDVGSKQTRLPNFAKIAWIW